MSSVQTFVFLALAFSIVIAIFAVQNTAPVSVAFLLFTAERVPVSVLVLASAALGAGVMFLLGMARELQVRWRQRGLMRQLKAARARLTELEAQLAETPAPAPPTTISELPPPAPSTVAERRALPTVVDAEDQT